MNVEVDQEIGAAEVTAESGMTCDCSECVVNDSEAFAITRSKAKLKSP